MCRQASLPDGRSGAPVLALRGTECQNHEASGVRSGHGATRDGAQHRHARAVGHPWPLAIANRRSVHERRKMTKGGPLASIPMSAVATRVIAALSPI
jgi:hypothetical protein